LKTEWQRHVLASSGYLELGMFDDAALVLEEIVPEDKTRNEVLGARVGIYMAARKWDMAAAVASHLVKVDPETASWWISLAYAVRCTESVENAEAILLRAQAIHPKVAMIAFNLACYASVTGRVEEAKERLQHAIELDKDIRRLAIDDNDLLPPFFFWNQAEAHRRLAGILPRIHRFSNRPISTISRRCSQRPCGIGSLV
jgi:Flp pilus assembly protein TadD